jgi:hypothetical protein
MFEGGDMDQDAVKGGDLDQNVVKCGNMEQYNLIV